MPRKYTGIVQGDPRSPAGKRGTSRSAKRGVTGTKPVRTEKAAFSEHQAHTDRDKNQIAKRNAAKGGAKTSPAAKGGKTRARTAGRRSGSQSNPS
jgi:hypothetical protein